MKKSKDLAPLSAAELAEAERAAKYIAADRHAGPNVEPWARTFLRLLVLHRAMERQSALLQSQVRQLTDENLKLEAALDAKSHV